MQRAEVDSLSFCEPPLDCGVAYGSRQVQRCETVADGLSIDVDSWSAKEPLGNVDLARLDGAMQSTPPVSVTGVDVDARWRAEQRFHELDEAP